MTGAMAIGSSCYSYNEKSAASLCESKQICLVRRPTTAENPGSALQLAPPQGLSIVWSFATQVCGVSRLCTSLMRCRIRCGVKIRQK